MTNALAKNDPPGSIEALKARLAPMGIPKDANGNWTREAMAVDRALRPLGAKVAPTIDEFQGKAWRAAMVMALSDLPADIAVEAIGRSMHQPIRFLSEAETTIRQKAESILRLARAELEAAIPKPAPSLPAPSRISREETDRILKEEWPSHGKQEKTVASALKIPNKDDAAAYAKFMRQWQIKAGDE